MAEAKRYKQCAVGGCRKKAVSGGKCKEHAITEKVILTPLLREQAEKINKVTSGKSFMDSVSFEAGVLAGKVTALFNKE